MLLKYAPRFAQGEEPFVIKRGTKIPAPSFFKGRHGGSCGFADMG